MKNLKVIIIMIAVLMVFNASASEQQHFPNKTFNISEQADTIPDGLHQEQQTLISFEIATNYCEKKAEDT
jgi:hypothetical protein